MPKELVLIRNVQIMNIWMIKANAQDRLVQIGNS